jgi:phenylacetate-CoA ligase
MGTGQRWGPVRRAYAIKREMYRGGRPGRTARLLNRLSAAWFATGLLVPRGWATLEVAGRRSGRVIAFPVVVADLQGQRYLVAMLGEDANWVRNVRAAGGRAVLRHGRREAVLLAEVEPPLRAPVLRRYLAVAPGARPHLPVDRRAPLAEFERVAARFPVFRVVPAGRTRPAPPGPGSAPAAGSMPGSGQPATGRVRPGRLLPGVLGPVDYSGPARYRRTPRAYQRLQPLGWLLTRLGLSPGYVVVVEVAGRRSGLVRRTTLVRVELGGSRYLVSLSGESHWVRNVRAAAGRVVLGRRRRCAAVLVEVPPAERPAVIRAYLGRARRVGRSWGAANEARYYFGVAADPSAPELAAVADRYPVFRIVPASGPSAGPWHPVRGRRPLEPSAATVALDALLVTRGGRTRIEARQRERLTALVEHARHASRFYAEHYRDVPNGPVELTRLPAVTKPELMAQFDDWVTDPAVTRAGVEAFVADLDNLGRDFLGRYVVFTTSGSTGEPALLVQDRRAIAVMTGLAYARSLGWFTPRLLVHLLVRGARQAAIFATGGHFVTTTMTARRLRRHPVRRRFSRFLSVLDPLPRLVGQLNAFRPALLASYASALAVLADEQRAGRLRISPIMIASGGELLLPAVRRRIETAFGCPVVDSYSASEALPLALPCRRGRQHVNADWFLVEPVDATGAPVPAGQRSDSVLVTNLANHVQPIIRYELGDSVVVDADPCPCSSPLPTIRVEGRTDEILRVPRPGREPVLLLPMALATIVEETPGVHRFQVVQRASTALAVRLEADPDADRETVWSAVRAGLVAHLAERGLGGVAVELAAEAPHPQPGNGKLRHVLAAPGVAEESDTGNAHHRSQRC